MGKTENNRAKNLWTKETCKDDYDNCVIRYIELKLVKMNEFKACESKRILVSAIEIASLAVLNHWMGKCHLSNIVYIT